MKAENLAFKTSKKIFDTRAIAFFIDFLILAISLFILTSFIQELCLLAPVWVSVYYTVTESLFGCTAGKFFMKLRVVDKNCNKPKFYKVLIRSLFYFIEFNPITFIFSYIFLKKSKCKQRLADKVSGIFVVYRKDLIAFRNNEIENSMNFEEFEKYHYESMIRMTLNGAGDYVVDPYNQYIEINNVSRKLIGIDNMAYGDILNEVGRGARFKCFSRCVSAIVISHRTTSDIYFIRAGERHNKYHMKYTIPTLLFGWWGIPWGIIWTISSIASNFSGGVDVTDDVINIIHSEIQSRAQKKSMESAIAMGKVTAHDIESKFDDMSDYEFKTKYVYNLSKFSPDVAELIRIEDELRKSKNHNYVNYVPRDVEEEGFKDYRQTSYSYQNNKKGKKTYIVSGIVASIFVIILIGVIGAVLSPTDYSKLASEEYDAGNYAEAIDYTDKYLKKYSDDVDAFLFKIDALYALKRYDEALGICNQLDTISSGNKENYLYMGMCNYNLSKFNESIKWLDKAISIDKKYGKAYLWKASDLYELQDYDNAIKTVDSLLAFEPNNSKALKVKGESLLVLKNYTESLKIIDSALKIEPENIDLSIDKMEVLYRQKSYSDLIELCKVINKKFPKNENASWYMGDCYSVKEDHKNAVLSYENALKINPKNDNVLTSIACEYYTLQDYIKAKEYNEKALNINADNETAIELKKELEEVQKPESVRIADFVKDNYLYLDKIKNADAIIDAFSKRNNISISDIQQFINSIKYKNDKFTFLISGQEYDYMQEYNDNNHIEVKAIDNNTKYIKIYMFTQGTAYEFKDALDKIKNPEKQNLIIDLRDNPGGMAYPTNNILDALLPECVTSYIIYRDGKINTFNSDNNQVKFKHIYIFVNRNSASSSELLSLGLKKYLNNVTIIGTPTVGKGVGQITFEEKKKKYVIYLVNHYWNVKEKNIMGSNIKPDISVKGTADTDYFKNVK